MSLSLNSTTALTLMVLLTTICVRDAFLLPTSATIARSGAPTHCTVGTTSCLGAKKRRRRRKDGTGPSSDASPPSTASSSELPDFDLDSMDAEGVEPQEASSAPKISVGDLEKVTSSMMGDPNKPVRSVNELIQDRSLESKLELDDSQGDASIPDFTQLAQASSSAGANLGLDNGIPMSRKKQRKADAIRAAADAAEEETTNPLSNIGFIKNEKGEVSPIKILEAGAWLGIFLLVGWELYLNSPLFQRAAPMAPVVYEILLREVNF